MSEIKQEGEQSEFNSALATLERIHNIKIMLDVDIMNEDYLGCFKRCMALWVELDPMLSKEEQQQEIITSDELLKEYWKIKNNPNLLTLDFIQRIMSWNITLRRLDQNKNMNLPKTRDPRHALARR